MNTWKDAPVSEVDFPYFASMSDRLFHLLLPQLPEELDTARLALLDTLVKISYCETYKGGGKYHPYEVKIILHALLDAIWDQTFPEVIRIRRNRGNIGRPKRFIEEEP